jgi:hypothetical protein
VIIVWFGVTIVRSWPQYFALGSVLAAWAMLFIMNMASPDAIVARNHLARAARGDQFDVAYVTRYLSADAVPAILANRATWNRESGASIELATGTCECNAPCNMAPTTFKQWADGPKSAGSWNWSAWRAGVNLQRTHDTAFHEVCVKRSPSS